MGKQHAQSGLGAKSIEERCGVDRESLWYTLHVALRKTCDSNATSLVWNLGHIEGMDKAIGSYTDQVWEGIKTATKTEIATLLKESIEPSLNWGQSSAHATLRIAFEMFDENDWEGMAAFLAEE